MKSPVVLRRVSNSLRLRCKSLRRLAPKGTPVDERMRLLCQERGTEAGLCGRVFMHGGGFSVLTSAAMGVYHLYLFRISTG
jgi:hypothetical protein